MMTSTADSLRKRVFFHIGAPKTGTTYLQNVLFQNREELAAAGLLYPYSDVGQSFRSMQDFRGVGWGNATPAKFRGEWDHVARRTRRWEGDTVIVSNELLGGSSPGRITKGVSTVQPAELHVIFTARDFARQLVSDWQEHVKHKHTVTLEQFVDDLIEHGLDAPRPFGELFWGMHDAGFVLRRWAEVVPAAHIHIVTVPHLGAPSDTLWRRFCAVTGLDPDRYDTVVERSNASMGVAETELVRRMNFEVQGMADEHYDPLVRKLLAEEILGGQSPRLVLPEGRMEWVETRSRRLIDEVTAARYDVVGDLEELMPLRAEHEGYVSPTSLTEQDLASAAIRAATGMLKHAGRQRRRTAELQHLADGTKPPPPDLRARGFELYWKVRGRAGRVARKLGVKR